VIQISYRPLPAIWPSGERTKSWERKRTPFKAGWTNTLGVLERELRHLGVGWDDVVIIEAGYKPSDLRMDGLPRKDARLDDPAVILSFQSTWGPLRYGCDTYGNHEANVRAIALALEALRAVDRYGVTKRGEQYAGWKALPASGQAQSTREHEDFIRRFSAPGQPIAQAYRTALKQLHPDVGGSREDFERLQRARVALGL
jgi:hypothetical protein